MAQSIALLEPCERQALHGRALKDSTSLSGLQTSLMVWSPHVFSSAPTSSSRVMPFKKEFVPEPVLRVISTIQSGTLDVHRSVA